MHELTSSFSINIHRRAKNFPIVSIKMWWKSASHPNKYTSTKKSIPNVKPKHWRAVGIAKIGFRKYWFVCYSRIKWNKRITHSIICLINSKPRLKKYHILRRSFPIAQFQFNSRLSIEIINFSGDITFANTDLIV